MKTAMQILIDEMTSYLEVHESPEAREVLRILKASAIRKYKKEEREQIRKAYNPVNFTINDKGELEYHGKVITIHNEFRYLSVEQKKDILITLINWANEQIEV